MTPRKRRWHRRRIRPDATDPWEHNRLVAWSRRHDSFVSDLHRSIQLLLIAFPELLDRGTRPHPITDELIRHSEDSAS